MHTRVKSALAPLQCTHKCSPMLTQGGTLCILVRKFPSLSFVRLKCIEKWHLWHRLEAGYSINTKPLNPMQQQPDQGCLLISWHELATNPITQNPQRSPHPSQEAQRESTSILLGCQQSFHWNQISFRKHIEWKLEVVGEGALAGGAGEWTFEKQAGFQNGGAPLNDNLKRKTGR